MKRAKINAQVTAIITAFETMGNIVIMIIANKIHDNINPSLSNKLFLV